MASPETAADAAALLRTGSRQRRLASGRGGLRAIPDGPETSSPFDLPEPAWVPDRAQDHCVGCGDKFTLSRRRVCAAAGCAGPGTAPAVRG